MITLYLKPEQEELLRVIARTSGVSVEGYLLTLIEAIVDPKPAMPQKGVLAAVQRLRNPAPSGTQARVQADDAVHQMRANVLVHQEKAVEAVTTMNLLRTTTEQQQRRILNWNCKLSHTPVTATRMRPCAPIRKAASMA